MPWTPSASQPLAPMPGTQPAPAIAPPPLDRDSLTTLVARPPAEPPLPSAATAAAAPQQQVGTQPPVEEPRASRRDTQSSSHERSVPAATKQSRKQPSRANKKAPTRSRQAQWRAPRQGLRTAPPPEEPSTMVKLLKSLNPFAAKEDDSAAAKSQASQKKADPKNIFWWGEKESTR
jgi:hypothetical protein